MRTTLLISTYNWPQALNLCLKSVLRQTIMPDEVVIADDGSTEDTQKLISSFKENSKVPFVHVWHEDKGFRLSEIRNKGIAKATGDYIIQIDGDIILDKHFIEDHIKIAEKGYFVCGSRTKLNEESSKTFLELGDFKPNIIKNSEVYFTLNAIRNGFLRRCLAKKYGQKNIMRLRGCNMAFWKSDIIKVNGYNEELAAWGHEDSEMAFRLYFSGVKKKFLKFGGVQYHIYHKELSRDCERAHYAEIIKVKENKIKWCNNGIDKHLQQ